MTMTALESLFVDEYKENLAASKLEETENTIDPFIIETDETFNQLNALITASEAVSYFNSLNKEELSAEALAIEEQRLFSSVPQSVIRAAGGEEKASEGFLAKIKSTISNFFSNIFSGFLKRMAGLNFGEQAMGLSTKIKNAPDFKGNDVTISRIGAITGNSGKTMWSATQMSQILMMFSGIDRHFEKIWSIAAKKNAGPFEDHILGMAKTIFQFVATSNKNFCVVGWNKGADKTMISMKPIDQPNVDWVVRDWSNGPLVKFEAPSSKDALSVLSQVPNFAKGVDKLMKLSNEKWAKDLEGQNLTKEDATRFRNTLKFFFGIVTYFRDFVQTLIKWFKACHATTATKQTAK